MCDDERVSAMLCFYFDDPDSMRRYRVCNQAEEMLLAIRSFDDNLRSVWKYGSDEDQLMTVEEVRNMLWEMLNQYDVGLGE